MMMTAIAMRPELGFRTCDNRQLGVHLMGASLPPSVRTIGALAALLLAVAVTGVVLVAFAVVMPIALIGAVVLGKTKPRSERAGWRPAEA